MNDRLFSGDDIFSDCVVAGEEYTGTRDYTRKGVTCQAWSSNTPHKISSGTVCFKIIYCTYTPTISSFIPFYQLHSLYELQVLVFFFNFSLLKSIHTNDGMSILCWSEVSKNSINDDTDPSFSGLKG